MLRIIVYECRRARACTYLRACVFPSTCIHARMLHTWMLVPAFAAAHIIYGCTLRDTITSLSLASGGEDDDGGASLEVPEDLSGRFWWVVSYPSTRLCTLR